MSIEPQQGPKPPSNPGDLNLKEKGKGREGKGEGKEHLSI
jgi:hypothetical protein